MSSIYIQEPPTEGKILLKTTFGELDIELWSRETPKACRNFVQLCLDGFYNGLLFHRVVKRFIAQTGDPTGTGSTSVSIYGAPFRDEIHSRLRFNRRGLVACANNEKDDNGSQFFITLDATPELQGKHTIFGKIAGNTLYNLIKLNDILIEEERPVYEEKIIKAEVLNNPFPDIVPGITSSKKEINFNKNEEEKSSKKASGIKNFKLLSFGDEAEEDEIETSVEVSKFAGKSKSTHDILNDPKLSSKTINDEEEPQVDFEKAKRELESIKSKLSSKVKDEKVKSKDFEMDKTEEATDDDDLGEDDFFDKARKEEAQRKLKELQLEVKKFKKEIWKESKAKESKTQEQKKKCSEKSDLLKEYEQTQEKYFRLKQESNLKGGPRAEFDFNFMKQSQQKFKIMRMGQESENETECSKKRERKGKNTLAALVDDDSGNEDINSGKWLKYRLQTDPNNVIAKDANMKSDDWYDIYDPRNPITKRRRETSEQHRSSKKSKS